MGEKLTKAQAEMLRRYEQTGRTTQAFGRTSTWGALVHKGLLLRSYGGGPIESEITPAGRAALKGD